MTIRAYQDEAAALLRGRLEVDVLPEWAAMADERGLYSPRLDIAVGPFATNRRYEDEYDRLQEQHRTLLEQLYSYHLANIGTDNQHPPASLDGALRLNPNARCFLAVEIENRGSRKHLMGGAINASALGRLGIAIGWTREALQCFIRLNRYLAFLTSVGKNSFNTSNLLVLSPDQFLQACRDAEGQRRAP